MAEAKPSSRSLAEFAAEEQARCVACRVCASPYREEIDQALLNGVTASTVHRWLREDHPDQLLGETTLRHHLRTHVKH